MDYKHPLQGVNSCFEINSQDKWFIYRRLQELEIPCSCAAYQPLTVQVDDPAIAVQVWSVTRQVTQSRLLKVVWLEKCWQLYCYRQE